jgi:YebC/PmpR family DNA-binding regulatory protein
MSGHSRWSTIKRKKGAADAKRGKVFTQLIRELVMAAKLGTPDPESNPRLRLAVDKARAQNMPKDTIERAIRRGSGADAMESYEDVRYEGYGPNGVAVLVEAITDNRARTAAEVRHIFSKNGGNLGATGCVSHLFVKKGQLVFERAGVDVEKLMEAAIEADAADVVEDEEHVEVQTTPETFDAIKAALAEKAFTPTSAEVAMVPLTTVEVSGKPAQQMLKLMELLDEHDDVKQVSANFDISQEEMLEAAKAS